MKLYKTPLCVGMFGMALIVFALISGVVSSIIHLNSLEIYLIAAQINQWGTSLVFVAFAVNIFLNSVKNKS